MKNYDEASVIRSLAKKNIKVSRTNVIEVSRNNPNVGNGTLGKLDYLVHYCGYTVVWSNDKDMVHSETPRKEKDNDNEEFNKPKRKKDVGILKRVHLK